MIEPVGNERIERLGPRAAREVVVVDHLDGVELGKLTQVRDGNLARVRRPP